ncbi:cysteine--tRNA ligase, partial [Candidatus Parcubacteria bacterium]|nr:cysteine--tRNA ligase [Candidatus Parcubacteria bacterium]
FAALQTHYRKPMEYSEVIIKNAQNGLEHLYNQVRELKFEIGNLKLELVNTEYKNKFIKAVNDDLNMPQALAVVQELLKSDLPNKEKLATVLDFDKVLGLNLDKAGDTGELDIDIKKLIKGREKARAEKNYQESDRLREEIEKKGYVVEDSKDGMRVYPAPKRNI